MTKYRIMLACAAGLSTSILVKSMEDEAKRKGMDLEIFALPTNQAIDEIKNVDIILIGPQMAFELPKFQKLCLPFGTPVITIDRHLYGTVNGKAILEQVIDILE